MHRAMFILLVFYFPLLAAAAANFYVDFRPDSIGSPVFRFLFLAWVIEGSGCLVAGVWALLRKAKMPAGRGWGLAALGGFSAAIGVPPAYIGLELAYKLVEYLRLSG